MTVTDNQKKLEELAQSVYQSEVLNNSFYEMWMSERMNITQVAVLARNYGEFTMRFPDLLCFIIGQISDTSSKVEYVKTLYSEMGYGDPERVHFVLFCNFIRSLTDKLGESMEWETITQKFPLLESTQYYLSTLISLYEKDPAIAAGAQLAQEWQAYTMLRQLYEGARQYIELWPTRDAFHEDCEFFYEHIGRTEKEHKLEALQGALSFTEDSATFQKLAQGFNDLSSAYIVFWDGIADEMKVNA